MLQLAAQAYLHGCACAASRPVCGWHRVSIPLQILQHVVDGCLTVYICQRQDELAPWWLGWLTWPWGHRAQAQLVNNLQTASMNSGFTSSMAEAYCP